jgi:ABC-type transport system involved in multi-copper enzyme maturation permease subunit
MLKKEILDSSRKLFECLLLLLTIPLAILWDKFVIHFGWKISDVFNFVFIPALVIYAAYSGATIFNSEKKNRAFEYLLSLPLPRWKVVLCKIGPRISFLFMWLIVSVFFSVFKNPFLNGFNLVILFLISLFLSILLSSVVIGFIEIGAIFFLFYENANILNFLLGKIKITQSTNLSFLPLIFSAVLVLTPLGIAFWLTFKNFDVKPLKFQVKPYFFIVLPSFLLLISFVVLFFKEYLVWMGKQ